MNPKNWLYILPLALSVVLIIAALPVFFDKQNGDVVSATDNLQKVDGEKKSNLKEKNLEEKKLEETISLKGEVVDTAQSIEQIPGDTLWKAFRRKPKSKAWKAFFDIKYEHKGAYGYYPKFTAKHWQFHNKEIEINGYMYPLTQDKKQVFFMLSFYPIQQCFFCGGAGPESIVEVNSPQGVRLNSKRIKVKGKLTLNTKIPERLFYILENATEVK